MDRFRGMCFDDDAKGPNVKACEKWLNREVQLRVYIRLGVTLTPQRMIAPAARWREGETNTRLFRVSFFLRVAAQIAAALR